jgi:hypothetical protein
MLVVITLNNGYDVMGTMSIIDENFINLDGALLVNYIRNTSDAPPMINFEKYCLYTKSFMVSFKRENVDHIFEDILPGIENYYRSTLRKMQREYKRNNNKRIKEFEQEFTTMLERMTIKDEDLH